MGARELAFNIKMRKKQALKHRENAGEMLTLANHSRIIIVYAKNVSAFSGNMS